MYHPGKTQPNIGMAGMQRTFYPKHCHYFGSGGGRDTFIILNNGGFNKVSKQNLGHTGVHMKQYSNSVTKRIAPAPCKDASTFYYQSDGSGRDSYVIKDNGGLRYEFDGKKSGDRIFKESLRNSNTNMPSSRNSNPADMTNYLNWTSNTGRHQ